MAIDPMLYEKYSGRKGDPTTRMGEALARSDRHKARIASDKADMQIMRGGYWRYGMWAFWYEVFRRVFRRKD